MNFTYFKFLFVNTIKKKPVWITWLLFVYTCASFIITLPLFAKMNTLQVWANTTMAVSQTFMGMIAALFTAVLAINVFKDSNDDGTELIIISKPISRFRIVMTKFLLFGFFCLLINLSTVLISSFTIFLPRTEPKFYVGLLVSMFIGNFVTFAIFGSISILLTVKFVKVGVIVTNIIITLVLLIYQTLTLFVFKIPSRILTDNKMTAMSYILHDRDPNTGEYSEDEVVKFSASDVDAKQHPCSARTWQDMKNFWEHDILDHDITPVLNVTDLAGQIALTYMSYKTHEYSYREAKRMLGISRFYKYTLTSPASPEIIDDIDNKKTLNWLYTGVDEFVIPPMQEGDESMSFMFPSSIAFDGIQPLTGTRLRGYTNKIPVGSIRSKDILSSKEIYFEKDEWNLYRETFETVYDEIFDWKKYQDLLPSDIEPWKKLSGFSYNWQTKERYYNELHDQLIQYKDKLNINSVFDLNERFIQFKNYIFWKLLDEENKLLNGNESEVTSESQARDEVLASPYNSIVMPMFGIGISSENWMMNGVGGGLINLLDTNTKAPAVDFIWNVYNQMLDDDVTDDDLIKSTWAKLNRIIAIYKTLCSPYETYLYISLTDSTRDAVQSGYAFFAEDNWISGFVTHLSPVPLGQNMSYFYYKTTKTIDYWIFAVIWGIISMMMFAAGMIVYNKYDVK